MKTDIFSSFYHSLLSTSVAVVDVVEIYRTSHTVISCLGRW